MLKYLITYLGTGVSFAVLDAIYLTLAGQKVYRPTLDYALADKPALPAAIVFYLVYILGVMLLTFVMYFVLQRPETMARNVLGKRATPQTTYAWLHQRGYDKPLFFNVGQQRASDDGHPYDSHGFFDTLFFHEMWKLATFNLGVSDVTGRDLRTVFKEGAIPSMVLMLPAYLVGMVLAGTVGKDHVLVRRLRTLTFGLLTPFYFIRAGSFVSLPSLIAAPAGFIVLLLAKMAAKFAGVWPVTRRFGADSVEAMYTTLLMSTGLTFGTISALFGLSHNIIDQGQYSILVACVIGSAVIPTLIANAFYLPHHLLPRPEAEEDDDAASAPIAVPAIPKKARD